MMESVKEVPKSKAAATDAAVEAVHISDELQQAIKSYGDYINKEGRANGVEIPTRNNELLKLVSAERRFNLRDHLKQFSSEDMQKRETKRILRLRDEHGRSLVHYLVLAGQGLAIESLISKNKNCIHDVDHFGMRPLDYLMFASNASKDDYITSITVLGCDLDHVNQFGQTVTDIATECNSTAARAIAQLRKDVVNDVETFKQLFAFVSNKNLRGIHDTFKEDFGKDSSKLQYLNHRDADGNTALHHAVKQGKVEVVMQLIYLGANINATNKQGQTPFHLAVLHKADLERAVALARREAEEAAKKEKKAAEQARKEEDKKAKAAAAAQKKNAQKAEEDQQSDDDDLLITNVVPKAAKKAEPKKVIEPAKPAREQIAEEIDRQGLSLVDIFSKIRADRHLKDRTGKSPLELAAKVFGERTPAYNVIHWRETADQALCNPLYFENGNTHLTQNDHLDDHWLNTLAGSDLAQVAEKLNGQNADQGESANQLEPVSEAKSVAKKSKTKTSADKGEILSRDSGSDEEATRTTGLVSKKSNHLPDDEGSDNEASDTTAVAKKKTAERKPAVASKSDQETHREFYAQQAVAAIQGEFKAQLTGDFSEMISTKRFTQKAKQHHKPAIAEFEFCLDACAIGPVESARPLVSDISLENTDEDAMSAGNDQVSEEGPRGKKPAAVKKAEKAPEPSEEELAIGRRKTAIQGEFRKQPYATLLGFFKGKSVCESDGLLKRIRCDSLKTNLNTNGLTVGVVRHAKLQVLKAAELDDKLQQAEEIAGKYLSK